MSAATIWTRLRHALGSYPSTARDWAVRVQASDVTRRELLALDEWLKADPRNAEAYAKVNKISHLGLLLRDHPEERGRLRAYGKLPEARLATFAPARRVAFVGVIAAASAAAVALWLALPLPDAKPHYASGRGEQRQVALADGSRMIVNTDSDVAVDYGGRERAIRLLRGEAFFDVAKDAARPFVVRTANAEVRAIGTRFSVRQLNGDTEVIVTEGRVQVVRDGSSTERTAAGSQVDLSAGSLARVSAVEQPVRVAAVDPARATAWTSGNVDFEEASLAEVIRDVNRYTMKQFVVEDPALNGIRFTGRFHIGDIESVKFALSARFDIVATEAAGVIRLSSRTSNSQQR